MAQRGRGNGVLDHTWSTIASEDQDPYALLRHSRDRSASRSGTRRPGASCIEGRVSLSTRRRHNPIQSCITGSCGGIDGSYRGHDAAIVDRSALEATRFASEPRLTYKQMAEIVRMIRWAANAPDSSIEPPKPVHFFYPSYNSAGDHSTWHPTAPVIRKHAHHLFKKYNRPAQPGDIIFLELLLNSQKRQFLRILHRNAPHMMIEALDFPGDPDAPGAKGIRVQKTYLMGDGYVECDPEGLMEHFLVTVWRLWHPMTTWARQAKVSLKATLQEIVDWGWDIYYTCKRNNTMRWVEGLEV